MRGAFHGAVRVVAQELHAKGLGALGHQQADVARAEDAERLVLQFLTRELGAIPLARIHGCGGRRRVARHGQHERHGLLGGGDDVGKRRIADNDTALGGGFAVDIVNAHAGTADDLELFAVLNDLARDRGGGTDDEPIVVADDLHEFFGRGVGLEIHLVAFGFQHIDARLRELLRNQYLHVANPYSSKPSRERHRAGASCICLCTSVPILARNTPRIGGNTIKVYRMGWYLEKT